MQISVMNYVFTCSYAMLSVIAIVYKYSYMCDYMYVFCLMRENETENSLEMNVCIY